METVGRVYMAASGAPDRNENHAQNIADVSLQLIEHVRSLELPSGLDIRIRIGNIQHIHSCLTFKYDILLCLLRHGFVYLTFIKFYLCEE